MSDLTQEQFEQLPDFAKSAFVQDGDKYTPAKDAKLKETLNNLDSKYKDLEKTLNSYEETKKAEIEAAREKALEEARTKGDVKAIEERYQQQMQDLEKRTKESTRAEVEKEFNERIAGEKADNIRTKIGAELGVDSDAGSAIAALLGSRVKYDSETGKAIFHDAQGSALSVDSEGFKSELKKEGVFKHLIKSDVVTNGGGKANGGKGGSAATKTATRAEFDGMSQSERQSFFSSGGKLTD